MDSRGGAPRRGGRGETVLAHRLQKEEAAILLDILVLLLIIQACVQDTESRAIRSSMLLAVAFRTIVNSIEVQLGAQLELIPHKMLVASQNKMEGGVLSSS